MFARGDLDAAVRRLRSRRLRNLGSKSPKNRQF